MKSDLDNLMAKRNLDAFVIVSDETYSAARDFMTNGARVTRCYVIKKHGEDAILIVSSMEVDEAAVSGLKVLTFTDLGYYAAAEQYKGDPAGLNGALWDMMLKAAGVKGGRIGIYGSGAINIYLELFRMLSEQLPQCEFVGEQGMSLFEEAMQTKDADEIRRIRSVAKRTNEVLKLTWDFIASHRADGDEVVNFDNDPLTIGVVKRYVRRALLDRELEDTGMIFAQGRDAGVPHSRGDENEKLRLGQSIVFDLFPRELGGGYHHDVTRTWCIGYAPDEVKETFEVVMNAFDMAIEATKAGIPAAHPQEVVLDYYESLGHETQRSNPNSSEGYVHSLGHGVGLDIHERPSLSHVRKDTLEKGNVITIEPGLYYPSKGFGVRVEDMVYIDESGAVVTLTDFHKELVLPLTDKS